VSNILDSTSARATCKPADRSRHVANKVSVPGSGTTPKVNMPVDWLKDQSFAAGGIGPDAAGVRKRRPVGQSNRKSADVIGRGQMGISTSIQLPEVPVMADRSSFNVRRASRCRAEELLGRCAGRVDVHQAKLLLSSRRVPALTVVAPV